ncbi:ATP-binding protein, partial [Hyalangium sp.]|uniref:ATP-binding protein n=1 Tax=Hyalangium sp. TaxID=2028555 RepID=UPI002D38EABA
MSAGPSLYNPRDTQPEQLDALLTGRTALLDELLGNLREQADGMTRQHWLLRGQRGMGKTHLAGVIHYRVKTDGMLNKAYLPLWLGEADTYEVYSAATLLKTIGERLAEETKDADLLARLDKLEGVGDEEGYFLELAELLSAEADRRQRVLLVLMENLDALLGSFGPKERKEQTRQLRSLLLHNRHFLFVSTTPTYYLNNPLNDPKEPLYAHLKERDLDHLTESETAELLRKLVQLHPREGSENFLEGKDGRLRLRVIHRLTGGLPRSIVMAFTAIREAAGIGSLVQELRALLDAQTAYFEARLSQLPARERAIVTTMALAPTNLTMKEIAKRSRLPERTLSTLIHRLEKDGHVRPVARSGGKGTFYELSEGLFRLWYQYRKGRPVLEPLVDFLAYWYRAEELEHVVTALRQGAEARGSTRAAELALLQAEEALRRASSEEGQRERERFWAECQQALLEEKRTAVVEKWAGVTARQLLDAAAKLNVPDEADLGREQIHELLQQESLTNMDLLPDLLA